MKRKISSMWRVVIVAVMVVSLGLVMAAPAYAEHTSSATVAFTGGASTRAGEASSLDVVVTNVGGSADNIATVKIDFTATDFTNVGAGTEPGGWTGSVAASVVTYTADAEGDRITPGANVTFVPTVTNPTAPGVTTNPLVKTTDDGPTAATLTIGADNSAVTYTADTPGTGGNSITVEHKDPGAISQSLIVSVVVNDITVSLATDINGDITSTAAEVATAVNIHGTASTLVTAAHGGDGTGTAAVQGVTPLTGGTDQVTDYPAEVTGTLTIDPGAAASLVVSGITDPFIAGGTSGVTVEALDDYDNRATDYTGEIHFTSSDTRANVVLPADYTFVLGDVGIKVFDGTTTGQIVRLVTKGEQTVTATDTALAYITGTQADITVQVVTRPPPRIAPPVIETNLFGEVSTFSISETGEILETITATSVDGNLTLTIPEGTIALDKDGNPLSSLTANVDPSPPPPPSHIIGLAYDFGSDGASFDPQITFEYTYDPAEIPEGVAEEDLVIAYYDEEAGEWVECECTCDPETHCVTASVCHFTTFAIIAVGAPPPPPPPPPPPTPAAFTSSSLSISPVEVDIGKAVSISALVTNTGEEVGSYTITLKIDGVVAETKEIALAGGTSKTVAFTTAKDKAGTYSVDVDGLMGSFMVKAALPPPAPPPTAPPPPTPPPGVNWAILGPIIAVAVFLAIFLPVRIRRRRASR